MTIEPLEIIRVKDIAVEVISADDEDLGRIFGYTKRQMQSRRKEMSMLPSQRDGLFEGGYRATVEGMRKYLKYRKTVEWEREMDKYVRK